eukprot:14520-Rhodomonas_salina.2
MHTVAHPQLQTRADKHGLRQLHRRGSGKRAVGRTAAWHRPRPQVLSPISPANVRVVRGNSRSAHLSFATCGPNACMSGLWSCVLRRASAWIRRRQRTVKACWDGPAGLAADKWVRSTESLRRETVQAWRECARVFVQRWCPMLMRDARCANARCTMHDAR